MIVSPVKPVRQIDRITCSDNHKIGQCDKPPDTQRIADRFEKRDNKVRLGRQIHTESGSDPLDKKMPDLKIGLSGNSKSQIDGGGQTDDGLPEIFLTRGHPVRILVHHLPVIVNPADDAKSHRDNQNNPDKPV